MNKQNASDTGARRRFVANAAKAVYVAPVVLSLKVAPAYAKNGSEKPPGGPPQPGPPRGVRLDP